MRHESFSEILRPTGRTIKFTQEELEEIERDNIRAQKDIEERIKRAE
ncbi:hypothetical protein [Methanimicrococcus stummii]|nr:hypothetical protein [Methanimicrococcus sp. Es2]